MRLIHSADWHIGQVFYGYDRSAEHTAAFDALCRIVAECQPDVLLVSGDVFHNPQPSAAAQLLFTKAVTELCDAAPKMAVVITSGNHDSATRHEVFSRAWRRLNVYTVGSVNADDEINFRKLIIELPSCFILAVPYIYGRALEDGLFDRLLAEVRRRNTSGKPVISMAHAMLPFDDTPQPTDFKGADEPKALELFGSGYDYLALGHVHRPSAIPGTRGIVRYSGSLVPVSFAETFQHSVVQLDIDGHGSVPAIEMLPVPTSMPVVSIPVSGFKPWSEALEDLRNFKSDTPSYIRVCVTREETIPADAGEILTKLCADSGHRFCLLHYPPQSYAGKADEAAGLSFEEFRELTPGQVADLYLRDNGIEISQGVRSLFDEVVESLKDDDKA